MYLAYSADAFLDTYKCLRLAYISKGTCGEVCTPEYAKYTSPPQAPLTSLFRSASAEYAKYTSSAGPFEIIRKFQTSISL